jgi:hypothetical protein
MHWILMQLHGHKSGTGLVADSADLERRQALTGTGELWGGKLDRGATTPFVYRLIEAEHGRCNRRRPDCSPRLSSKKRYGKRDPDHRRFKLPHLLYPPEAGLAAMS